ncbi:MAG TPA: beta-propeller fold lactonase family protein, partial [Solirubrobacteraceae bacterium]|nr:beta-propeller fold lactonase family protein [Solirubrobacteraceae bacterium]
MIVALCLLAPAAAASEPTYTRAPGSPLLTPINGGSGLAFSPSGELLARGTAMFSVGASGVLAPVGGSPPDPSATAVAFSPSGAVLAAANNSSDTISMFSVGSSGALTSVSGSPFSLGAEPTSVVFSPSGELLAVTAGKEEAQSLYMFSVSASGALTPVLGSPYSVSSSQHVAFSPTGSLLAVQLKTAVRMFSVSSSGALTEVPGSPFAGPEKSIDPKGIAFRPNGNLLTSFLSSGAIAEVITTYSVTSSGAIAPLASGAGSTDPQGGSSSVFSPDGTTAVAPQMDSSYFSVLSISQSGAVTAVLNGAFATGPGGYAAFSAGDLLAVGDVSVFVPSSTSASTNWVGALGSEGYDLAGWNGESDLSDLPASVSLVKGTRCTWAASTSNVLALTSPNGLTRTAAGYCNPEKQDGLTGLAEVQVKLTFSEAYSGNLRVYSVLWEGAQGLEGKPHESITVGGESVSLEDNIDQGNPSFSEGGWALFPVSEPAGGSLTISGKEISGIFLGEGGSPPAPTVTTAPEGSWAGTYGSSGYDLADWDGSGDMSYL